MTKQGVNKILTTFLLLLYVAMGVGVGVHHCDDDNSSYLFSSLVSSECDDIHQYEHDIIIDNVVEESCSCSSCPSVPLGNNVVDVHDVDCCVDEIFTLELAQLNTSTTGMNMLDTPLFSVISTVLNFSVVEECVQKKCVDTSISIFNLRHFLAVISVWII